MSSYEDVKLTKRKRGMPMQVAVLVGLLALVGIAVALTIRKTRPIGLAVFVISLVILVAGVRPWL